MPDDSIDRRSVLKAAGTSVAVGLGATTTAAARSGSDVGDYAEPAAVRAAFSGHEDLLAELAADDLLDGASVQRLLDDAESIESGMATIDGVEETPAVELTRSVEDGEVVVHALPERDVTFAVHRGEDGPTPYGVESSVDCDPGCWEVCPVFFDCYCVCPFPW